MAGATKTTLATAIKTIYEPGMVKTFWDGTPTIHMFASRPNTGGDSIDWRVHYAGNTSGAAYDEGDTPPAAGYQAYTTATIAHQAYWATVQITGHAKDAMKNGYFNGVIEEMDGGVAELQKTIEDAFVAAIIDAIDDDTTYAGLTRATYGLASDVTAGGSAALTLAMLSEMYETLKLAPRSVVYQPGRHIILSAPEQETAYTEVATGVHYVGDDESTGVSRPYTTSQTDSSLDAGMFKHAVMYNKLPWVTSPNMTNSYVFLMDRSQVIIEEARPVTIDPLGKIDDSDRFLITWNGGFAYKDPYRAGRIEALTT